MKTDPNLCPPPAPESGEGRRPSDRPSPVTALGGTPEPTASRHALGSGAALGSSALGGATLGGSTEDRPAIVERRLRAVRWSDPPPAGERDDGSESDAEEDLTPSTSGEFDPYRFGSHMLPYEFLQDALKEPLRAPRDDELLHETLPPYASAHPTPLSPSVSTTESAEPTVASVAPLGSMPPAASVPPVVVDPKRTLVTGLRLSPEAVQRLRGPELVTAPGYEDPAAARRSKQKALFWAVGVLGVAVALAGGLWAGKREAALAAKAPRAQRLHEHSPQPHSLGRAAVQPAASPAQAPVAVEPVPRFDALEAAARSSHLAQASAPPVEVPEPVAPPPPAASPVVTPPVERPRQAAPASAASPAPSRATKATKKEAAPSATNAPVSARQASAVPPPPPRAERSAPLAQPTCPSAPLPARDFQLRD